MSSLKKSFQNSCIFPLWVLNFASLLAVLSFAPAIQAESVLESLPASDEIEENFEGVVDLKSFDYLGWQKYVRGFRKDHNFCIHYGYAKGNFKLNSFSGRKNEIIASQSHELKFQYAFHLQLIQSLGYYLGSEIGYQSEKKSDPSFKAPSGWSFPGITAGFVADFGPSSRLLAGVSYHLQRWNNLGDINNEEPNYSISVTTRVFSYNLGVDWFFALGWAVRASFQQKRFAYLRPLDGAKIDAINADLAKEEDSFGIGLVYHLL